MLPSFLIVARHGKQWGVSSGGEVVAVARTKRGAMDLAYSAAEILRDSGGDTEVKVASEPKSFSEG